MQYPIQIMHTYNAQSGYKLHCPDNAVSKLCNTQSRICKQTIHNQAINCTVQLMQLSKLCNTQSKICTHTIHNQAINYTVQLMQLSKLCNTQSRICKQTIHNQAINYTVQIMQYPSYAIPNQEYAYIQYTIRLCITLSS